MDLKSTAPKRSSKKTRSSTSTRSTRALSVKKYEEEYQRLNVKFDVYLGESMVGKEWQDKALEKLEEMGLISDAKGKQLELVSKVDDETELTSDSKGAKLVDLEKWKLGKAVLRK